MLKQNSFRIFSLVLVASLYFIGCDKNPSNISQLSTNKGVQAVSAASGPFSIYLASPQDGAIFNIGDSIDMYAVIGNDSTGIDSSASIKFVLFYRDSLVLGRDSMAPYHWEINNASAGTYRLHAKAIGNNHDTAISQTVTISVQKVVPNKPPTVSITSPVNGAIFQAGNSITVTAAAQDSDGVVQRVEFLMDSMYIGSDSIAPFEAQINSLPAGTHELQAIAFDDKYATGASSVVTITVKGTIIPNKPPTVSITSPANGSVFKTGSSLTINASAKDVDGVVRRVEFFMDSILVGIDSLAPYQAQIGSLYPGTHRLKAIAYDNKNAAGVSAIVTISVIGALNKPPTVSITSPANGAVFNAGKSILISAAAKDPDGFVRYVQFVMDSSFSDSSYFGMDSTAPYQTRLNNLQAGSYRIKAVATDNKGAIGVSPTVTFTVKGIVPNKPPVVSITSPANNSTLYLGDTLKVAASASDPDGFVSSVKFYRDSTLLASDTSAPYMWAKVNPATGVYRLHAVATDNSGATATSSIVTVTVVATRRP